MSIGNLEHFDYKEMIKSDTATRLKIDNEPKDGAIIFAIYNTLHRLDEIRSAYGKPIIITSGYRCPELNKAVGGTKNSQHCKGEAADLKWDKDLLEFILKHCKFDQLIEEASKRTKWIHIAFKSDENKERQQYLKLKV